MITSAEVVSALRSLAAAARATGSARTAVIGWHLHAPPSLHAPLLDLARTVRLGADPCVQVAALAPHLGAAATGVAGALDIHRSTGASLASLLEGLADATEQGRALSDAAAAATSTARASQRLLVGLGLVFLVLMPLSGGSSGPVEIASVAAGALLAVLGCTWVRRLMPRPPIADPAGELAELVATMMRAGASPGVSLDVASRTGPPRVRQSLASARRFVQLGVPWSLALMRDEDPGIRSVGAVLARQRAFGSAIAEDLVHLARVRSAEQTRAFEAASRKAAVAMLVPLAVCLLPAFALVALVPLFGGLGVGS